jgi:16S rRNA (cytosine1402-N4)-methyltransferase
MVHIPVLQKEVLENLDPKPNENFIDCTVGGGGHALAILEKTAPKGKLLGIDWDQEIVSNLKSIIEKTELKNRLLLVNDNFAHLKEIVKKENFKPVKGILFDLGMSTWHLKESGRGFSFLKNEPLDMRYDSENPLTAEKIINFWSEPEIERILKEFSEEKFAGQIARQIIKERRVSPIKTTFQLVRIVKKAVPTKYQYLKIHFATRTFQALRIAVNDELNNVSLGLSQAEDILGPGGKIAVISFHSLEDRIVKNFFKNKADSLKIITKKPIIPTLKEIQINPSSRSSKLRAAIKI